MQADPALPELLDGLHFHTLCEQDADALALTLAAVEAKFGGLLPRMKWLNFGGGHHITRPGYRLATLEQCITETQKKYGVQVYLEPGEAWALNAGCILYQFDHEVWEGFRFWDLVMQLRNGGSNYCLALCIQFSKR